MKTHTKYLKKRKQKQKACDDNIFCYIAKYFRPHVNMQILKLFRFQRIELVNMEITRLGLEWIE